MMFTLNELFENTLYLSSFASIIALLILLVKIIFKKILTPNWHYYIWFILILRLSLPYFPTSSFSIFNALPKSNITEVNIIINNNNNNNNILVPQKNNLDIHSNDINNSNIGLINKKSFIDILAIIWLSISCTLVLVMLSSYIRFIYINHKYNKDNSYNLVTILHNHQKSLNIKSNIKIYFSDLISTPIVYGFSRKKILIPKSLCDKLSINDMSYILLHELSHIKRFDIEVNFLITLLQCFHWFNPVLWLIFGKIKSDCESACDFLVLKKLSNQNIKNYAETLLKLALLINYQKTLSFNLSLLNKKNIKRRIIMISKFKKASFLTTLLGLIIILVISVISLTNPKVQEANLKDSFKSSYTEQVPEYSEIIASDKIIYKNNKLGFQLTMPLSWKNNYVIITKENSISFNYVFKFDWMYDLDSKKIPRPSDYGRTLFWITELSSNVDEYPTDPADNLGYITFHGKTYYLGCPTDTLEINDPDRATWEPIAKSVPEIIKTLKEIDITYDIK